MSLESFISELKDKLDLQYSQVGELVDETGIIIYNNEVSNELLTFELLNEVIQSMGYEASQVGPITYAQKDDETHTIVRMRDGYGVKVLIDQDHTKQISTMY